MTPQKFADFSGLSQGKLTVFVFGHGNGEAIALFVPDYGWILVDSCTVNGKVCTLELVRKYPAPVRLVVWTHPHDDHCRGLTYLIDELEPDNLVVPAFSQPAFRDYINKCRQRLDSGDKSDSLLSREALNAFQRIQTYQERRGPDVVLEPSSMVAWQKGPTEVRFWAPSPATVGNLTSRAKLAEPNALSVVFSVTYGSSKLLLSADLETAGWQLLQAEHPRAVEGLDGLKVPHHASHSSFHSSWMVESPEPRQWWITPKNRSHLPTESDIENLSRVQPVLCLTSPPAWWNQSPDPNDRALAGASLVRRPMTGPFGPLWLASFNQDRAESCFYGQDALRMGA